MLGSKKVLAGVAMAAMAGAPALLGGTAFAANGDVTSAKEAQRVDGVNAQIAWERCVTDEELDEFADEVLSDEELTEDEIEGIKEWIANLRELFSRAECGDMVVPLDYDVPNGEKYTVPVIRQLAKNQDAKIGSLFVNPGGPGGSATSMALYAPQWISPQIADSFDIVGVEPRQMGAADWDTCHNTVDEKIQAVGSAFDNYYPTDAKQIIDFDFMARRTGEACAKNTETMSASSTAQVVRDMEVARQAVGAESMNILGFSYGTAIGQYYANMFPDRMRAIVADGVVDGRDWTGLDSPGRNLDERMDSAAGAEKAFKKVLELCDATTHEYCLAAAADADDITATKKWEFITSELEREPLEEEQEWFELDDEGNIIDEGVDVVRINLSEVQALMLGELYYQEDAPEFIGMYIDDLYTALQARQNPELDDVEDPEQARQAALGRLRTAKERMIDDMQRSADKSSEILRPLQEAIADDGAEEGDDPEHPYYDWFETFSAVTCADGRHPFSVNDNVTQAVRAGETHPNFGQAWAWGTVQCSGEAWRAQDEDAYRDSFAKKTANPVLFVGNRYDPATNQSQAEKAAARQPGAALITSDSWGHTAYGTSECVTSAVDEYLMTGNAATRATCKGDYIPFTEKWDESGSGEDGEEAAPVDPDTPEDAKERLEAVLSPMNRSDDPQRLAPPVAGFGAAMIHQLLSADAGQ